MFISDCKNIINAADGEADGYFSHRGVLGGVKLDVPRLMYGEGSRLASNDRRNKGVLSSRVCRMVDSNGTTYSTTNWVQHVKINKHRYSARLICRNGNQ